jgi:hypothetical protein
MYDCEEIKIPNAAQEWAANKKAASSGRPFSQLFRSNTQRE